VNEWSARESAIAARLATNNNSITKAMTVRVVTAEADAAESSDVADVVGVSQQQRPTVIASPPPTSCAFNGR
jgi:hypothetical protein